MDAELKAKWLVALRGDEFKQTTNCLRDSRGLCCLGVLAEVLGCSWDRCETPTLDGESIRHKNGDWLQESIVDIPTEIQKYLAGMNDTGASFSEIADYIERNL